jgi:hypothetical protein
VSRKPTIWTKKLRAKVVALYPFLPTRELAAKLGMTYHSIRCFASSAGLRKQPNAYCGRRTFTEEEKEIIARLYPDVHTEKIAKAVNCSVRKIYQYAQRNGLKKSPVYVEMELKRVGKLLAKCPKALANRFQPGRVSHNKGRKGWCPPGSERTWFRKGHSPVNTLEDGAIVIRTDTNKVTGRQRQYKWIRLAKMKWAMLHVVLWEKVNGKTPKGMIIVFKDGNSLNCTIDNLECITHAQHMLRTQNTDAYIAKCMATIKGGKGRVDRRLYAELLGRPDLIELKRQQLKLNKEIRANETASR